MENTFKEAKHENWDVYNDSARPARPAALETEQNLNNTGVGYETSANLYNFERTEISCKNLLQFLQNNNLYPESY